MASGFQVTTTPARVTAAAPAEGDVDEGTMQAFRQLAHPDSLASNQSTLWDSDAGTFDVLHSIKAADGRMDDDRLLQGSAARCGSARLAPTSVERSESRRRRPAEDDNAPDDTP